MADQIQTNYPLDQERGQVGAVSRMLAPHDQDRVAIAATGAGMKPGQAFKFDASGNCVPLADLADSVNAEGILGFEYGTVNQTVAGGTNNTEGIVFAEGDLVKYTKRGYVLVVAGGTLAKGDEVGFNPTSGKWEAQDNTGIVCANAAVDTDALEVYLKDYTKSNADLLARVVALEGA